MAFNLAEGAAAALPWLLRPQASLAADAPSDPLAWCRAAPLAAGEASRR